MRSSVQLQIDQQYHRDELRVDMASPLALARRQRCAVALALVQSPPKPLPFVEQPAGWAPLALRASLGLVGTMLTLLSLWSIAPPPL